jgi:hypothetical protein
MYGTIMCNRSGIWSSGPWNTKFRSIFYVNWRFSVKPKADTFVFWGKIWKKFKPRKNSNRGPLSVTNPEFRLYDQEIPCFGHKLAFFGKTEG